MLDSLAERLFKKTFLMGLGIGRSKEMDTFNLTVRVFLTEVLFKIFFNRSSVMDILGLEAVRTQKNRLVIRFRNNDRRILFFTDLNFFAHDGLPPLKPVHEDACSHGDIERIDAGHLNSQLFAISHILLADSLSFVTEDKDKRRWELFDFALVLSIQCRLEDVIA